MEIKEEHRWLYNFILIHVARTWERIRLKQPYEEMPQDNLESSLEAIPEITEEIFNNSVMQGFILSEDKENYWLESTEDEMSDWYIERIAEELINKNYLS
jgi:hypothetical protein